MKIILFQDANDEWRFRIRGRNGRTMAASEGYKSKRSMMKTIASLKRSLAAAEIEYAHP